MLACLAPLATLRVFYALAQDFFTGLFSSRCGLTFQLIWLTTLVPALVAGAAEYGILAVAVVQVVVAVLFLVSWYLTGLQLLTVRPRMTGTGLFLPIVAAAGIWSVVFGAHRLDPDNRADLVIAASAALAAMGLLAFRLRKIYAALRRAGAGAARSGRMADVMGPALAVVFEAPLYPVAALLRLRVRRSGAQSSSRDLESKVRAGAKWSMLNSIVVRVSNFLVGALLARTVFGPAAWGLYAVSQIVLAVLLSMNELGVSAAIVGWEGDIRSFARTVVTLSLGASTVMYAALYVTAPSIARTLGSPDAAGMLRILSICVIIDALCAVPLALLTREFAQGRRMLVDVFDFVIGASVTVWLAFTGQGVMSFAWGALAGCIAALIVSTLAAPYLVVPGWNTAQARQLLKYGLPLAGASLFALGVLNVDSAIVGATLGPSMLGLYQLAFDISSWPVITISLAVQRVSFAGFSRVADSGKGFADALNRTLALLMALTMPACILLATLAGPLIHAIYGEQWVSAADSLRLLALLGLMRVAFGLFSNCMAAAGRRNILMGIQGLWLAALIPALLVGARLRGINGVSVGHFIVAAALVGPVFLWALSRAGITVRSMAGACLRPALGGALMAAASLLVIHVAGGGVAGLAAAIAAGCAVYLPVIYPMRALLRRSPVVQRQLDEAGAA